MRSHLLLLQNKVGLTLFVHIVNVASIFLEGLRDMTYGVNYMFVNQFDHDFVTVCMRRVTVSEMIPYPAHLGQASGVLSSIYRLLLMLNLSHGAGHTRVTALILRTITHSG